jgi:hypothetical protein
MFLLTVGNDLPQIFFLKTIFEKKIESTKHQYHGNRHVVCRTNEAQMQILVPCRKLHQAVDEGIHA